MKKKRRILLLLAMIMILSSSVFAADFADIKGHWAEEEIKIYANKGILKGYEDKSFKPDKEMTRLEFVIVLNRLLNYGPSKDYTFKDVSKNDWFYSDISKAYENNYLEGYGDGYIDPYGYITREQAFKILGKIFDYKDQSVHKNFSDYEDLSSWAKEHTNGLINHGFLLGDSKGNLNPKSKISRSELVKLLNNIIGDLSYNSASIEGNFMLREKISDIEGKNIKGNLYIQADALKGNLNLKNIEVEGNIYILGSADIALILESTSANKIVSEKAKVTVSLDRESEIKIDEKKENIEIIKIKDVPTEPEVNKPGEEKPGEEKPGEDKPGEEKPDEYKFVVNEKVINLKQGELVKVSGKFTKNKTALENKDINIRLNFLDHVGTTKTKEDGSFEYVFKLNENIKPGDHKLYVNASKFEGFEGEKVEVLVRVIEKNKPVENKIKEVINPEPIKAYFKSKDSNEYEGLDLPSKVEVVYEDGSKGEELVEWNLKDFNPIFEMEYEIEGKIDGYDDSVVIKVIMEVNEDPIVHKNFEIVDYKDIVVKEGEDLNLPDSYKVSIEGKLTSNKSISWGDIVKLELGENIVIGSFEHEGLVYEFEQKVMVEKEKIEELLVEYTVEDKGKILEKDLKELNLEPMKYYPEQGNLIVNIKNIDNDQIEEVEIYLDNPNLMSITKRPNWEEGGFDNTRIRLFGKNVKKGQGHLLVKVELKDGRVLEDKLKITVDAVSLVSVENPEDIELKIESIAELQESLDLPKTVIGNFSDGTQTDLEVEWDLDVLSIIVSSGEYTLKGKVKGSEKEVELKLNLEILVKEIMYSNGLDDIKLYQGDPIKLPKFLDVTYIDTTSGKEEIEWPELGELEPGEHTIEGRLKNYEDEIVEIKVIVEERLKSDVEIVFNLGSRDGKGGYNLTKEGIKEIKGKPGEDFPTERGQHLVIYINGLEEEITDKNIKVYLEDNLMEINPKFLYYDGGFDYTKLDLYGKRAKKGRTNLIVEVSLADGSVVKESIEITIGDVAPEVEGEVELVSVGNPKGITIDIEDLENIELPETVLGYFSDGTSKDLKVTWDTEYLDSVWQPSKFKIKGKIEGYDGDIEASLEINVIQKLDIVEIKELEDIVIKEGDKLSLPETIEVSFEDGEEGQVELVWDKVSKLNVGEHIIKARLKDYDDEIVEIKIIVEKKVETLEKIDLSKYNPKLEIFKHDSWGGYTSNNVRLICDEGLEEYYCNLEVGSNSAPIKKVSEAMTGEWGLSISGDIKGKKGILKVYKGVEENGEVRAPRGDELKTNILGELELIVVMEGEDPKDYEDTGRVEVLGDRLEVSDMSGMGSYIDAYIDGYDGFEFKVPDLDLAQIGKIGENPIKLMVNYENLIRKTYTVQITRNQGSVIVKELELKVYEKQESYRMKNSNLPEVYNLAA